MPRRLPLLRPLASVGASSERPASSGDAARMSLGRGSIGLADTESGLAAAALAVELSLALTALGAQVGLVLLGFEGVPALPRSLSAQLGPAHIESVAFVVDAAAPRLPALPAGHQARLWLWLGLPALSSFVPTLAILLAADRPLTSWPAPLRARRGSFQLELSGNRPGLAPALAGSLNDHGFLLRG
jgi:hypothetical protein